MRTDASGLFCCRRCSRPSVRHNTCRQLLMCWVVVALTTESCSRMLYTPIVLSTLTLLTLTSTFHQLHSSVLRLLIRNVRTLRLDHFFTFLFISALFMATSHITFLWLFVIDFCYMTVTLILASIYLSICLSVYVSRADIVSERCTWVVRSSLTDSSIRIFSQIHPEIRKGSL